MSKSPKRPKAHQLVQNSYQWTLAGRPQASLLEGAKWLRRGGGWWAGGQGWPGEVLTAAALFDFALRLSPFLLLTKAQNHFWRFYSLCRLGFYLTFFDFCFCYFFPPVRPFFGARASFRFHYPKRPNSFQVLPPPPPPSSWGVFSCPTVGFWHRAAR